MNAKKLQDLIETLKTRILNHGSKLAESEALTRYALVDPLLRELGWDTEDPAQVIPEYKPKDSRARKADYVLLGDDRDGRGFFLETKPVLLIEAKKLFQEDGKHDVEKELLDAASQAEHYSSRDGVLRYFAATDGRRWYVYDRKRGYGPAERQIKSFDLMDGKKAVRPCMQAKELWRSTWHIEFVYGYRVDADGKVRSLKNGRTTKFFEERPDGTRWILPGRRFLDAEGWVLTDGGNRSSNFEHPCPPETAQIKNGKFLDADGKEILPKKGRRR